MSNNQLVTYLKSSKGILLLIILVGAVLRFWNYFQMPFTYDEMSALLRTNFTNFNDVIEKGVKVDTHPPGVQVFMYYWTQLFGQKEWVVKLPFTLMGLGSIVLTFSIIKDWLNETAALLICSIISVSQFPVMYSQIARPYISGMFLVLCMVFFWSQLIRRPETHFWRNWSLTVLFAGLCAYNHHFSLLTAGIIGFTGTFVIDKKHLLKYLSLAPVVVLLYLPNIGIFLHQLDRGGVGEWLGAPKPTFILEFIAYNFHFSYFLAGALAIVLVYSFYRFKKENFQFKFWIISFIWFIVVFLVGYFYSVYVNPVLQFSMLLFVFPFFLIFLFGWIPKMNGNQNLIIVLAVLLIGSMSLTLERKHFQTFYQNRYFQMKADATQLADSDTQIIFINYEEIAAHPFPENYNTPYYIWDEKYKSISDFKTYVSGVKHQKIMLGYLEQMPKELLGIALEYFPYVQEQRCYNGATTFLLSKVQTNQEIKSTYYHISHSGQTIEKYMNFKEANLSPLNAIYHDSTEWSLGLEVPLSKVIEHQYDIINIKVSLKLNNPDKNVTLVSTVKKGEEELLWRASDTKTFTTNDKGYTTLILTFDYNNISFDLDEDLILNAYIWNQEQQKIFIHDFSFEIIRGNRNKYSLYEKIN